MFLIPELLQISPQIAADWDRVGIVGFGAVVVISTSTALIRGWVVMGSQYQMAIKERDREAARADSAEEKYIELLKQDIAERKERDRTLELITRMAANRDPNQTFGSGEGKTQ